MRFKKSLVKKFFPNHSFLFCNGKFLCFEDGINLNNINILNQFGWIKSIKEQKAIDENNNPTFWYTYPSIYSFIRNKIGIRFFHIVNSLIFDIHFQAVCIYVENPGSLYDGFVAIKFYLWLSYYALFDNPINLVLGDCSEMIYLQKLNFTLIYVVTQSSVRLPCKLCSLP